MNGSVPSASDLPLLNPEPKTANARWPARPDPLYHSVFLALCGGVIMLASMLSIRGGAEVLLPIADLPLPELCLTRRLTGLGCPGCGMTRCFISLARGDLAAAWSYNPAGLFLFALVALQIPYRSLQLWRIRRGHPEVAVSPWAQLLLAVLAVAMVVQWSLRLAGVAF